MRFRFGFIVGAAVSAVIVTNLTSAQRQRLRSTASSAVERVKSSHTADRIVEELVNVDARVADVVADITPSPAV